MAKKTEKYVPQTQFPKTSMTFGKILRAANTTPKQYIEYLRETHKTGTYAYWSGMVRKWDFGEADDTNFFTFYDERTLNRVAQYVFHVTPHFTEINDKFLAEFDSREDLQEIYRQAAKARSYLVTHNSECVNQPHHYFDRPQSYNMWEQAIQYDTDSRKKIELARETPYQEGDLVLLRTPSIGDCDYDPMYISPWRRDEGETPDKTVPRIGTVLSVTEKVTGWRATRGSKTIKVVWMGVGDGKIYEIPEKHLKFHERPTYKNGMKVRE